MAAITYKCPNCGGGLIFEPETQKYKCEYCLSRFMQADLEGQAFGENGGETAETGEEEAALADGGYSAAGEAAVYSCPSCGAEDRKSVV